jgi:ELWxxDGT repeat protein
MVKTLKTFLLLTLCVCAAISANAAPRLVPVADTFLTTPVSSNPGTFTAAGSRLFFSANDGVHGDQIWSTDGTAAGTSMTVDAGFGTKTIVGTNGNAVVFTVGNSYSENAIWRTDGTPSGTWKIGQSAARLSEYSGYATFTFAGGSRVFVLTRQSYSGQIEIHVSNGGANSLVSLGLYWMDSWYFGSAFASADGRLYFTGGLTQDAASQLWVTDGTAAGTIRLQPETECVCTDLRAAQLGSNVVFRTHNALWKTDGTAAGTVRITDMYGAVPLTVSGNRLYFTVNEALWSTDGTTSGTQLVSAQGFVNEYWPLADGRLFFSKGPEYYLWLTNGSAAGTVQVTSARVPGVSYYVPAAPIRGVLGNTALMAGWDTTAGTELWSVDLSSGTAGLLKDIDPRTNVSEPLSSEPGRGAVLGSKLIFAATSAQGRELWQTDGTAAGTSLLFNIAADAASGAISGTVTDALAGTPVYRASVTLCGERCEDTVLTKADGTYRFDGVIVGTYTIRVVSRPHLSQVYEGIDCPCPAGVGTPLSVTSGMENSGVDFALTRGGAITGTVTRRSTGQVLRDMLITVVDSAGTVFDRTTTSTAGTFRSRGLPAGTYYAHTSNSGSVHGVVDQVFRGVNCGPAGCNPSSGQPISVVLAEDTTAIDFALDNYGTISGTVRDDFDGRPLWSQYVYFKSVTTGAVSIAWTSTDGRYTSPALHPDSYYVSSGGSNGFLYAAHPDVECTDRTVCQSAGIPVPVEIGGAVTGIDLILSYGSGRIGGTITDRNGAPFNAASVQLLTSAGVMIYSDFTQDGRYMFIGLNPGTYYVRVIDELYPNVDCFAVPCSFAGATPIVITSREAVIVNMQSRSQRTSISGRLIDAVTSEQIYPATVTLYDSAGKELSRDDDWSMYEVSAISRGSSFYVVASAYSYVKAAHPSAKLRCAAAPCVMPPGAVALPGGVSTGIDIRLERAGSISGAVTNALTGSRVAGAVVSLYDGTTLVQTTWTSPLGAYRFDGLWGPYRAVAEHPHFRSQLYAGRDCAGGCDVSTGEVVDVLAATTRADVNFAIKPFQGAFRGKVTDQSTGMPFSGATVTARAANGQVFSTISDVAGNFAIFNGDPFDGLLAGEYVLYADASQPRLITFSDGSLCSSIATCNFNSSTSTLTAGQATTVNIAIAELGISTMTPSSGPLGGGNPVTIKGKNFLPDMTVSFDGMIAPVLSLTATEMIVGAPAWSSPRSAVVRVWTGTRLRVLSTPYVYSAIAAPVNLTASPVSTSQINLAWSHDGSARSFLIERRGVSGSWYPITEVSGGARTYSNAPLPACTEFFYRVTAISDAGTSPVSNEAPARTTCIMVIPPSALSAVAASSSQINLAWSHDGSARTFRLERRGASGPWYTITELGGAARSYSNAPLPACSDFYYRLTTVAESGTSVPSNEAYAKTTCPTATAPTGLTARAVSASQIDLSWSHSGTSSFFSIERRGVTGDWYLITKISGASRTYSNGPLPGCTQFFYRVLASGTAASNEATATTTCAAVERPAGVTATTTSSSRIDLAWTFGGTASQFRIERRGATGSWYLITIVSGTARSYANAPLPACTPFWYRISAVTVAGTSAPSDEASGTTSCP